MELCQCLQCNVGSDGCVSVYSAVLVQVVVSVSRQCRFGCSGGCVSV